MTPLRPGEHHTSQSRLAGGEPRASTSIRGSPVLTLAYDVLWRTSTCCALCSPNLAVLFAVRRRAEEWRRNPVSRSTVDERFWSKVVKEPSCWLWTAARFSTGTGQFRVGQS